jgi:ABC-2 type transport system permease protein/sodium transport system permease protein
MSDPAADRQCDAHLRPRFRRVLGGRFARLCLKELRETLRDRRTIVTLVLMPLLVYPLLSIAFQRFLVTALGGVRKEEHVVGVPDETVLLWVRGLLSQGEALLAAREMPASPPPEADATATAQVTHEIRWVLCADLEDAVANGEIDLGIRSSLPPPPPDAPGRGTLRCELLYRENSTTSKAALRVCEDRLQVLNEAVLHSQLHRAGIRPESATTIVRRAVSDSAQPFSLTTLIPLILILMTVTGAVYPAIDLTAGERERGTLEALMAAPVPRLGLLAAKYVAVMAVALLTAVANLLAMTLTLVSTGLATLVFGRTGLPWLTIVEILALLVLFAAFFSAVLLAVTSFARSFKEAQAYLIPLMLVALAPGICSLMPGLKLAGLLAVAPLVNIALLSRDLLDGSADPVWASMAVVSTLLYAIAAIGVAARVFGTDALLYGSEGGWSDLFRRPARSRPQASVSGALLCLAVLLPCYVLAAGYLARLPNLSPLGKLAVSGLATAALFGVLPLLVAFVQRVRIADGFQLRRAGWLAFLAAVVLGGTLWPWAHELFLLNRHIGLATLDEDKLRSVRDLLESWRGVSPVGILLALAIAPAVCEELFFRGYLFRALLAETAPRKAILISAALFGLFHVLATHLLAIERFLPSTFLGLVLGWVCWRSGSVLPGMVLHACHNGLLLLVVYYRDQLAAFDWDVSERGHLPARWLIVGAAGLAVGMIMLMRRSRGRDLST